MDDTNSNNANNKFDKDKAEKEIENTLAKLNDPDSELTEDERNALSEKALNDYSLALRQEFAEAEEAEGNKKDPITESKQVFKDHLPVFVARICDLALNSRSDAVQFSAAKFGIQMGFMEAEADGDPIRDLLTQLQKPVPDKGKAPASAKGVE